MKGPLILAVVAIVLAIAAVVLAVVLPGVQGPVGPEGLQVYNPDIGNTFIRTHRLHF
jgi:hypothetical protein